MGFHGRMTRNNIAATHSNPATHTIAMQSICNANLTLSSELIISVSPFYSQARSFPLSYLILSCCENPPPTSELPAGNPHLEKRRWPSPRHKLSRSAAGNHWAQAILSTNVQHRPPGSCGALNDLGLSDYAICRSKPSDIPRYLLDPLTQK